jgi:hypothetical protein
MKAYRIKDWDRYFEKADSRKCKNMKWVAVPNTHDTAGYATLTQHPQFAEIYTAWILMLQVASKMHVRGELVNGKPLTAHSLAIRTRTKPEIFEVAFKVLASPEIDWIEVFEWSSG